MLVAGGVAYLAGANRGAISVPAATPPAVRPVTAVAPAPSLLDVGRALLSRTVTIEALAGSDEGLGTGWLFDTRGDFVTNAHVVVGEQAVRIRARDGTSHVGTVIGIDPKEDVAVVRSSDGFPGTPLPVRGQAEPAGPAAPVVILASSRATGHGDLTVESLNGVRSDVPVTGDTTAGQKPTTMLYHDMLVLQGQVVYPGNSGGPAVDAAGEVIGIVTLATRSAPEGFAIPLSRVLAEIRGFTTR